VRQADGGSFPGVQPRLLRRVGGVRVGIFGLTTDSNRKPYVKYLPFLQAAEEEAAALKRDGAEVIIALTHLPMEQDLELARRLPDIDLIAGGHEHDAQLGRAGGALILKADSDLRSVWVVSVTLPADRRAELRARLLPLGDRAPRSPALGELEDRWLARLAERLGPDEKVAESEVTLEGLEVAVRSRETNLGNLIADALREEGKCDLAAVNGGAIRIDENLPPGPITRYQAAEMLLFRNRLARLKLPGRVLAEALENSAERRGRGGFLQLSGVRVTFAPWEPLGQRARRIEAAGAPLEEERSYTLCTLDYLAQGGDGYKVLKEKTLLLEADAGDAGEMLIRHLRQKGRVAPREEGRIRFLRP